MRNPKIIGFVLGVLLLCLPSAIWAQGAGGRGSIGGTVTDSSGAVVAGVSVSVLNTGTGLRLTAQTNESGAFIIPQIIPGDYTVEFQRDGFKTETRTNVILTVDQAIALNVALTVGATSEQVLVKAAAVQLDTEKAEISMVFPKEAITELPLNGRNPANLVLYAPGMTDILATRVGVNQTYTSHPAESGASASGGRQGSTYYLLDGSNNMDPYLNLAMPFPNPEATHEFRVITNNFDAQYGFSPGAVVSIATNSGTNQWHGNAFEFLRNDAFNASDYFAHVKDTLKRNQFGGSLGGPILKDRLFIFGNYQRTMSTTVSNGGSAITPTAAMRQGDFSSLLPSVQIHDPNGVPYPGNIIPSSQLDPGIMQLMQYIPVGTEPDGLVRIEGGHHQTTEDQFTIRGDYNPSDKHRFNGHIFYDRYNMPVETGNGNMLLADRSWDAPYKNVGGGYIWTISPNLVNQINGSWGRLYSNSLAQIADKDGNLLCLSKFSPAIADASCGSIGGFANYGFSIGVLPSWYHRYIWNITEALTINKGKHLIVAGGDIQRMAMADPSAWLSAPMMGFRGYVTGNDAADMLIGRASWFQQGAGSNSYVTGSQLGFYVQDRYRLTPTLVISAGLRWEPYLPPVPYLGRFTEFRPGQQSTRYPNAPLGLVFPGDKGVPAGGVHGNMNHWNPRLGVAWSPTSGTSVRSAFGIFTAPLDYSYYTHGGDEYPFSPSYYVFQPDPSIGSIPFSNPWQNYAPVGGVSPFPPFATQGSGKPVYDPPKDVTFPDNLLVDYSMSPDFDLARAQYWNLSIEQHVKPDTLLTIAYVGGQTYHLPVVQEKNPAVNNVYVYYPQFAQIHQNESTATSSYHSLQLSAQRSFATGLKFGANYTWAKTIDSASSGSIAFAGRIGNPYDLEWNRGISDLNIPQTINLYWVYRTPGLQGQTRVLATVLGNWETSGLWHARSGIPFSIPGGQGNNNSGSSIGGDRADLVPGAQLNQHQGSKSQWLNEYFNTAAFVPNAIGTFGDSARNLLTGPGYNSFDLAFSKNFPWQERYGVQVRWEMYNAFNHPTFGSPNTNLSSSLFGQIYNTGGPARVMQAAVKFSF